TMRSTRILPGILSKNCRERCISHSANNEQNLSEPFSKGGYSLYQTGEKPQGVCPHKKGGANVAPPGMVPAVKNYFPNLLLTKARPARPGPKSSKAEGMGVGVAVCSTSTLSR